MLKNSVLSNGDTVLFVFVGVSMEINTIHYSAMYTSRTMVYSGHSAISQIVPE